MLSIEDPSPDPSCSSPKASDLPTDCHEAPYFSIRDYVSKSRSKDIGASWPFSEKFLQLCLDNGIRDLLPPFETSSLVRSHCLSKVEESEQLPKCCENKTVSENGDIPANSVVFVSSDQYKVRQDDISGHKRIQSELEINASSVTSHDLIKAQGISNNQYLEKECGLAVKSCTDIETSKTEDLVSSFSTVTDPMASKVCPVCKSFTSSSNTTLNAHIDRCLSSDQSNAAIDVTDCRKHKGKPRKKRLMVDIYATAPYCTLEELDKRNGTNWATDLSLVAPPTAAKTNLETKRTKLSVSDTVNRGDVGDIYVDSNGTKILILSKFDDSLPSISRKNFKLKKNAKHFKASRTNCLIDKKKCLKLQYQKFTNDDNPQKKKLRGVKEFTGEIEAASERDNTAEARHEKGESPSQLLSAPKQVKNSKTLTLGHWVCSKRSDLSRKLDGKDNSKGLDMMAVTARKLPVTLPQPDLGNSSTDRSCCALHFSRSSKAIASSPKTKIVSTLSTEKARDSGKKSPPQPLSLNSRLLPESDRLAAGRVAKISSPNMSCHPSLKARKSLDSKKSVFPKRTPISLEARKVAKSEKLVSPKKFRKHRSVSGCSKQLGEKLSVSDVSGGCHGSIENFDIISSRATKVHKNHPSNFSENQEKRSSGVTDPLKSTVTAAPISGNNLDPSPGEHEEFIFRNESLLEPPCQRSTRNQEAQCGGNAISNLMISRDIQTAGEPEPARGDIQTDTASIQEPHPCYASQQEMGFENNQENSSTTSVRIKSNQDHSMIVDMESSGSPVSAISVLCSPSLQDDKLNDLETDRSAELPPVHDKLSPRIVRKDNKVKLSPSVREPSCSCSQSRTREPQLTKHVGKKMASNLFVKTSTHSSYQPGPSLESPTESVMSMASSKSAVNISNPCSPAMIHQATSNPILRLMGKDLVVNKEKPVQLPHILPCDPDYSSRAKLISFGIPDHSSFNYNGHYHYQIQSAANHQIPSQPHQRSLDKLTSTSQCSINRMVAPHQYWPKPADRALPQEVIVIDDDSHELGAKERRNFTPLPHTIPSSNLVPSQRVFSCLPPQNPHASTTVNFCQSTNPSGSFVFPSPLSLYFSPPRR